MFKQIPLYISLLLFTFLGACSSIPKESRVAHDPWESYNRGMHRFNSAVDGAVLKPVAKGYKAITPDPVEKGIGNVFSNIGEVPNMLNNLLQFKLKDSAISTGRLLINSTLGIYGIFDVASAFGLEEKDEDFGQTLGKWGVGNGPYFVLPFLGPSTVRDATGFAVDTAIDPLNELNPSETRYWLYALRLVHTRAGLLNATEFLDEAALDPYVFLRESYLLQRQSAVLDGALPDNDEAEDDLFDN